MIHASRLVVFGFIAAVSLLSGRVAQAQADSSMSVNPVLAERGKSLFPNKGCSICHSIGGGRSLAGPDLLGVTDRRSVDWLKRWLQAPAAMYDSDPVAKRLVRDAKGAKMPNLHLSDADIDALINYLAQESQKKH